MAIGNSRIVAYEGDHITFCYKTRCVDPEWKTMTLWAVELHRHVFVLPPSSLQIGYLGLLANRNWQEAVGRVR